MKQSKKEVEQALITIGESLSLKDNIIALIENCGLHTTFTTVIHLLFIHKKESYFEKDDKVFNSIELIREYGNEMSKYGEVNFDVPFNSDEYIRNYFDK